MAHRIVADVSAISNPWPAPKRKASEIRDGLAPGVKEAQLRLLDGHPLTSWLSTQAAFDAAVDRVLATYPREQIRVYFEEAL